MSEKSATASSHNSKAKPWWQSDEVRQQVTSAMAEYEAQNKQKRGKRAGRLTMGVVAKGTIFGHNVKLAGKGAKAKLGKEAHGSLAKHAEKAAPRLRELHEKRVSAEMQQSRFHRIGNVALRGAAVIAERTAIRSSRRVRELEQTEQRYDEDIKHKRGRGRLVDAARAREQRLAEEHAKIASERRQVADKAVLKYRDEHPEIAEQERARILENQRRETGLQLSWQRRNIVDYFGSKQIGSFAKTIPRRPRHEGQRGFSGDYMELAKDTLKSALGREREGGTVQLLSRQLQSERIQEQETEGVPISAIRRGETAYDYGVSTMLWKLGFVEFEKEEDINYGHGKMNPNAEWEQTETGVKARLAYDPQNVLHRMLDPNGTAGQMVQLEMARTEHGYGAAQQESFMNVSVVEAPTPAPAAEAA